MRDHDEDRDTTTTLLELRAIADLGRTPEREVEAEAAVRARLHAEMTRELEHGERARPVRGRRLRAKTAVATLAAVGVVAAIGGITIGGGDSGPVVRAATADAATVARLGQTLAAAPAPTGDATLTSEHFAVNGQTGMRYNLVTDDRSLNYFGISLAELRAASAVSATGNGKATGPGTPSGWIEAAAASAEKTPQQAAEAIDAASGIPNLGKGDAGRKAQFENHVWVTVLDVLELSGGRPDVRAGALKAVSAIDADVSAVSEDGRPAIRLAVQNPGGGAHYVEALTIDAETGTPIRFTGGTPGKTPDTASTYRVDRVLAADYGH